MISNSTLAADPQAAESPRTDTGLRALVMLLGFHGIAADEAQLRHSTGHGDPLTAGDLVRLARLSRPRWTYPSPVQQL